MNIQNTIIKINELNPELAKEVRQYVAEHANGLVWEDNLPEATRYYKRRPQRGNTVNILPERGHMETDENKVPWIVDNIRNGRVIVHYKDEQRELPIEDVVVVAGHDDVIYPGLKVIDKVERGNADDPYHMVINAENYHALEMLSYAYTGKVDCIYIDPPYNTGAKDWKYNNNYVGQDDQYRHSKWLSFMERRLEIAKGLLNPDDSVLIVTIDEKEYLRLGMLLEQMFPDGKMQMVSTMIAPQGNPRKGEFSRCDEYIYIIRFGDMVASKLPLSSDWKTNPDDKRTSKLLWQSLIRTGNGSSYENGKRLFYPIYVSKKDKKIVNIGDTYYGDDYKSLNIGDDILTVLPFRKNGEKGHWCVSSAKLQEYLKKGYVKLGKIGNDSVSIKYLLDGQISRIENGEYRLVGYDKHDNSVIVDDSLYNHCFVPVNQWRILAHDATRNGTGILKELLPDRKFPYPKSVYAVEDVLRFFVANKPNALIVDFFAGSGTTAHATMLLNHLDGGHRRCISVTNNEVSAEEEKRFIKAGLRPYDEEWQKYGIARYVTWERVKAAITGINTLGEPIKGDYKFTEEFPMSEGFRENAIFCELTYESEWDVRLDYAFDAIAPILWMQAGCKGCIPKREDMSNMERIYNRYIETFKIFGKF